MSHYERLIEAVEEYESNSWICIPLIGKQPLIQDVIGYRNSKPTLEQQLQVFENVKDRVSGIGLVTGSETDLAVLDLEADEDFSKYKIPDGCPVVESGRFGRHYYFNYPPDLDENDNGISLRNNQINGDLKLNGGYIVAPPSLNIDTKKEYIWIKSPTGPTLPEMPEWLLSLYQGHKAIKGRVDWSEVELTEVPVGSRHTTAVKLTGKLLHHIPEKDWDEIVAPLIRSWNEFSCNPPMDDKEVLSIYSSLSRAASREKQNTNESSKPGGKILKTLSLKELLTLPEESKPRFLIDKLVPENGITYIYGAPGANKSWVMLEMIKAVASGGSFLETYPTVQKKVMVVDEESGDWELKRRAELLSMNPDLPIFFHCLNGFKLDVPDDVSRLVNHCKELEVGLVALDPFVSMHSGEENSATEMQKVMEAMQQFTLANITVMFIHHSRKGGFGNGAQNSRGSSAIHGRADSMLSIDKISKGELEYICLQHVKSRRGKAVQSLRIIMSQPIEDGPIKLLHGGNDYTIVKKDKARDVLLDLLKDGSQKRQDLITLAKESSKIGKNNVIDALKELENDGLIFTKKIGRELEFSIFEMEE